MDSSKERYERRCNGVYLYHYTYNFFHNNRPGKPLPGHSSFLGLFWALFLWVGMEGSPSCALERNKKDALQRNSGIVLSPFCALERNKGVRNFQCKKYSAGGVCML